MTVQTYTYCCGTEFDCFEGIFDLEQAAFWGECAAKSFVSPRKLLRS